MGSGQAYTLPYLCCKCVGVAVVVESGGERDWFWGEGCMSSLPIPFFLLDAAHYSLASWSWPQMGISSVRYCYLPELLQLEEALPQSYHPSWPRGPTPLRPLAFARCLVSHPDRQFTDFIVRGLSVAFRIGYTDVGRLRSRSRNHPSCIANPSIVDLHIARELAAGRLVGPLPSGLREQIHTSPLGLVPKGHVAGQWRLIVDLSSPMSSSINDGIAKDLCLVRYASMDKALDLKRALGPGTKLVKMDLNEAYRVIRMTIIS